MGGSVKTNPRASSVLERRKHHAEFYKSIHKCRVTDIHFEKGTVAVRFLRGGSPLEVPIPLVGLSIPDDAKDKRYQNVSWGMYYPQVGDIIFVGFDPLGDPFSLGYNYLNFRTLKEKDDAYSDSGGIGWDEASGKRLKPGDWTFKSARGASLYLGDRARIASGPHSITLDKTLPNGEISIQTDHLHTYYGTIAEKREGSARRIAVPGVDTSESPITGSFGTTAQECTDFVRRGALTAPGGQLLMVHRSDGEVIDEKLVQVMVPSAAYPSLATALTGTNARMLRAVKDDATGMVDMYVTLVDNLGNWGMQATTATGLQWSTPAATWTINSNMVSWTSTAKFDIVTADFAITASASYSVTATTTVDIEAGTAATLKGLVSVTLDSPIVNLGGTTASEFLVKGTSFITQLQIFMTGFNALVSAVAGDTTLGAVAPATKAAFSALAPIAVNFQAQLASMLSTTTKTK